MVPPKGIHCKVVKKGIERKGRVAIVFAGPFEWSGADDYVLRSLASLMDMRLKNRLREDLGEAYQIDVSSEVSLYPRPEYELRVSFGCDPDRARELARVVFEQIDSLGTRGPDGVEVAKLKEMQIRKYETDLESNEFWL